MNDLQQRWVDDENILNSEKLWRHFNKDIEDNIVRDPETGEIIRPSSAVFNDSRHERSVDRAALTTLEESFARKNPGNWIAEIQACVCREVGFVIEYRPTTGNPAHSVICGNLKPRKKNKTAARTLAEHAILRKPPC